MESLKKNIGSKVFACILFIILYIIFAGMLWTPIPTYEYQPQKINLIKRMTVKDILKTNQCSYTKNGTIKVKDKTDPYIIFNKIPSKASYIIIRASKINDNETFEVYYDTGKGYNEQQHVKAQSNKKNEYYVSLPQKKIRNIRFDLNQTYKFNGLELYSGIPDVVEKHDSMKRLVLAFLITLIIWLLICFVTKKYNFVQVFLRYWEIKKHTLLIISLLIFIASIVGLIFVYVFSANHNNYYKMFAVILTINITVFVYLAFQKSAKLEHLTSFSILAVGVLMILMKPYGHIGWDIDSHYKYALAASYIGETRFTQADLDICNNSTHFVDEVKNYKQLAKKISYAESTDNNYVYSEKCSTTIAHVPYGLMIAVLRLLGCNVVIIYILGRLPSVFIYSICVYFGMRKLNSGKMIYASIAMTPTVIFMAADYSYDYWVIAFSMLGVAYFVSALQQNDRKISTKDTYIMSFAIAISCIPKQIYLPLCIIPFLMPWDRIENKKRYYRICVLALLIILLLFAYRAFFEVTGTGDLRGGAVNPRQQILYIISNPMQYTKTLIEFLRGYFPPINVDGITLFAYLGHIRGGMMCCGIIFLASIFDKQGDCSKTYPVYLRFCIVVLSLGIVVMCATALYIAYTPVAENSILGCQPRYALPVFYPVVATLFGSGVKLQKFSVMRNETVCKLVSISAIAIYMLVLYMGVYDVILIK